MPSALDIGVTYIVPLLFKFHNLIDDGVEEPLCPAVSQVEGARPADPVMDGESDPDQRGAGFAAEGETLAVSYKEIGFQMVYGGFNLGKVDVFQNFRFRIELRRGIPNAGRKSPALPSGSAEDGFETDLDTEGGQPEAGRPGQCIHADLHE